MPRLARRLFTLCSAVSLTLTLFATGCRPVTSHGTTVSPPASRPAASGSDAFTNGRKGPVPATHPAPPGTAPAVERERLPEGWRVRDMVAGVFADAEPSRRPKNPDVRVLVWERRIRRDPPWE